MTVNATAWARRLGCCALAFVIWLRPAPAASASAGCAAAQQDPARNEPWPAPLDRKVTLQLRDVPLRDALDRLAAAARVRFSYTDELLPLDRSVCISLRNVAMGDALARMLEGVRVTPVAAGTDQVILAPARLAAALDSIPAPAHVVPLDRIVVTGSASGGRQRELPVALSVVSRKALEAGSSGTMSQIMDATVPGVWMWEQSPASVASSYGSIRGASSFGLTSPKVYLDGIQIANPLLLSQISPGAVERIEVIRGPQGAALYGADALSGVVNIVTRREHLEPGTPRRHVQSAMGMTESSFAAGGTLSQDHAFSLRGGSDLRSGGLDIDLGSAGPFLPGAFNRHATLNGNGRVVGARTIVTGTARFFAEDAGVAHNPLLGLAVAPPTPSDSQYDRYHRVYGMRTDSTPGPQALREYTVGGTATFMQDLHWTHAMTLGLDGYSLQGVPQDHGPIPSAASDSAFAAARGSADRGTLRLSSVGRFGDPDRAGATLTFAAEQSILRENTAALADGPLTSPAMVAADRTVLQWQQTSAAIAQAEGALRNSLFLTAGLRAEQDAGLAAGTQRALLPVVGAALAREAGPFTIKFRAAYGRGIRPPQTAVRETMWTGIHAQVTSPDLAPERQSGVEAGVDILLGDVASFQLTRYSQTATGLIQWVGIPATTSAAYGGHAGMFADSAGRREQQTRIDYELENLGAIANRGWEMQATANLARLWLTGTLAYTDSRVQSTAGGYLGDMRPGDRVLGVPAWTGSLMASWNLRGWASSLSAYRAYDWINYDRLGLAQASLAGRTHEAVGWNLRNYWKRYDGNTHLRASASRDIGRGLTFLVTGDNLLNKQLGEPDNTTVLPGRTISLGVRAAF